MPSSSNLQPELQIQLFGRFLVKIDGREVGDKHWSRRSAKALVKLLSLTPSHTLHREQIIESLWPDLALRIATNNLDKAIHGARRAFEPDLAKGNHSRFLLTPRNQIVLTSPGALRVDAHIFERSAHQALRAKDPEAARAALRLCAGPLLVDDLFEEWTSTPRESLRQLFRITSLSAAERFAQEGDPFSGIELARRLVHEDAADEAGHQLLMRLYAESGRPDQALTQFAQCHRSLQAAGLEPGPELTRLHQALRDVHASRTSAIDGEPVPAVQPFDAVQAPHVVPLSFRNGIIRAVRSAPDGRSMIVNANWDQCKFGLYRVTSDVEATEQLLLDDVHLFAVSPDGCLIVGLAPRTWNGFNTVATLAILPAAGGTPSELLDGVQCADLQPGHPPGAAAEMARRLAIVREVDSKSRLEFPIGRVLFETGGWISHLRFCPTGRRIAFIEHPIPMDDEGQIVVIDLAGHEGGRSRILAKEFLTLQGLAWLQDEVWFTAARRGTSRALYRLDMQGAERLTYQGLGNLRLHDAVAPGALLICVERDSFVTIARHADDPAERDITWHTWTTPRDISADGQTLLIEEGGMGGRHHYAAYLRSIDGNSTRLIADGVPLVLSPDQRRAILRIPAQTSRLAVLDLASGTRTLLGYEGDRPLTYTEYVAFFPDGNRIAFSAVDGNGDGGIYTQDLSGAQPLRFAPGEVGLKMFNNRSISPDGTRIILKSAQDQLCLYRLADGSRLPLHPLPSDYNLVTWADDGAHIFVRRWGEMPSRIYRCRLADGHLSEWLTLGSPLTGDVKDVRCVRLTRDGRSYAYSFKREFSDLYSFEDVR